MEEETEMSVSRMNRVYYAARDGMAITLYAMLNDNEPEYSNKLISQKVLQEDGQCCSPFIVAARFGHNKVVKMLLDKFTLDIEQEGRVKFDGYIIEGASALWCAAGVGHLNVVKTLVKAGANVNHPTKTNSTPVRAACFDGRLDIVKYLTDHSANIHIANKHNNTCLMIAAYKGHLDIVSFLLENGADPNEQAQYGETALHFAAECGHCTIVKELLKHGSKMTKNAKNMSPLISAAERARADVVDCLIEHEDVSKEDMIEAYELLGASFANDKDHYCLQKAYTYLHKAMALRYSDPNNIIKKVPGEPIAAYENWREAETVQRLEIIKNNHNAIHMESLTIRERILGRQNPDVPQPVIYRGAVFADNARFDRCIDLWLHALNLRQMNNMSISKDLLRFAQVFSQMIHVGVELKFLQVLNVLEASVVELGRNKKKLIEPEPKEDSDQSISEEIESNITITLYILTILTKLMTLNEKGYDETDIKRAHHLVHKLCALQILWRLVPTWILSIVKEKPPLMQQLLVLPKLFFERKPNCL
ncbi:feminization 1-like isoform X1 [Nasonia vitripennis]|uniref:Protein fem-1 homolog B n=1 Tax=Nasonia vitripennis TaxID=7425 RepID=A0A7M7PXV4_NASVI|nr:feminization 1-like isoform X1 [Nasonia vitripennis]